MSLRTMPIPHRLVLAVSVPAIALLVAVGFQVSHRSSIAGDAAEELAASDVLSTLAAVQTANVLPDLTTLQQQATQEGIGGVLAETAANAASQQYIERFIMADEARSRLDAASLARITPEAAAAFDRQRQSVDAVLAANGSGQALSDDLVSEVWAAREAADLAVTTFSTGPASDSWLIHTRAIDASRATVIEYSYVMATLLGLEVADESYLIELGDTRTNATQRLLTVLQPDFRDQLAGILESPTTLEWQNAAADARAVAGGRSEPRSILEIATLGNSSQEVEGGVALVATEAIEQVRSDVADVESAASRARTILLALTALILAATAGLTSLILRSILSPLRLVSQRTNDLAEGTLETPRADHGDHDELADLGNTVETIADGLKQLGKQFDAMADDDLEDPSFDHTVPGPLGAFVQDWVKEVREAKDNAKAEPTVDDLTGLLNRKGLAEHLGWMASGPEIAVVYVDLDDFQKVNDDHGHHHGDAVLKIAARRLLGFVREEDPVCRLEGDEFVLLVTGVDRQDMPIFTSRLEIGLSEPISFEGVAHVVQCSIGVGWLAPGDLLEPILEQADREMLEARANRPDRIPR